MAFRVHSVSCSWCLVFMAFRVHSVSCSWCFVFMVFCIDGISRIHKLLFWWFRAPNTCKLESHGKIVNQIFTFEDRVPKRSSLKSWKGQEEGEDPGKYGKRK